MQTFFTIVKILWNKGSWKVLKWKIGPFMLPWVLISPLVVRFTWYANKLHVANSLSDPSENVNGHLFLYSLKTFIMSSLSGMIEAMTKFHDEFLKQKEKSPRTKKKKDTFLENFSKFLNSAKNPKGFTASRVSLNLLDYCNFMLNKSIKYNKCFLAIFQHIFL